MGDFFNPIELAPSGFSYTGATPTTATSKVFKDPIPGYAYHGSQNLIGADVGEGGGGVAGDYDGEGTRDELYKKRSSGKTDSQ